MLDRPIATAIGNIPQVLVSCIIERSSRLYAFPNWLGDFYYEKMQTNKKNQTQTLKLV